MWACGQARRAPHIGTRIPRRHTRTRGAVSGTEIALHSMSSAGAGKAPHSRTHRALFGLKPQTTTQARERPMRKSVTAKARPMSPARLPEV